MTVFVYVDTSKEANDPEHIKVFANVDAAEKWFEENDPEGVAFEYQILDERGRLRWRPHSLGCKANFSATSLADKRGAASLHLPIVNLLSETLVASDDDAD